MDSGEAGTVVNTSVPGSVALIRVNGVVVGGRGGSLNIAATRASKMKSCSPVLWRSGAGAEATAGVGGFARVDGIDGLGDISPP